MIKKTMTMMGIAALLLFASVLLRRGCRSGSERSGNLGEEGLEPLGEHGEPRGR